ncbi:MAG: sulfatase-like hydrolase/transferase, partial [Planctomycetota bacterium]
MRPKSTYDSDVLQSNRRHFLKSCVVSGLFAGSVSMVQTTAKTAKATTRAVGKSPNIIFIFADDWGYGDLGIHGSAFCKTPHLDRMAKEGIDFQQFTVN